MAINIKGQVKMLRYDCAAHLEDQDDQLFWEPLFKKFAPERKILYITHSRSEKGNRTTGVGHCLNFRHYLGPDFIICIDSDYRRLLFEPKIDIRHFIFQTYTYSFENHLCFPDGLNDIVYEVCHYPNTLIDFKEIITTYSQLLYEALMWHLYFQQTDKDIFNKAEFRQLLSFYFIPKSYGIQEEIKEDLEKLRRSIENKIKKLKQQYPHVDLTAQKEEYKKLGLNPMTTFLFIRGHNIFDSISRIGRAVCTYLLTNEVNTHPYTSSEIEQLFNQRKPFKHALFHNIHFSAYKEIKLIEYDIINFFNARPLYVARKKKKKKKKVKRR